MACHPCPWPSPRPPSPAADGAAGAGGVIGWVVMGRGGKRGGIPTDPWPCHRAGVTCRGHGGLRHPPAQPGLLHRPQSPKWTGKGREMSRCSCAAGSALGRGGWLWGFAEVVFWGGWSRRGHRGCAGTVGCRVGGLDPLPTQPWQCHMRCPGREGTETSATACPLFSFIVSAPEKAGGEHRHTHRHAERGSRQHQGNLT